MITSQGTDFANLKRILGVGVKHKCGKGSQFPGLPQVIGAPLVNETVKIEGIPMLTLG